MWLVGIPASHFFWLMNYKKISKKFLSDLHTPVSCYLKLRQKFPQLLLLESSDYSSKENSRSFICFDPIEGISLNDATFTWYKQSDIKNVSIKPNELLTHQQAFLDGIKILPEQDAAGVFGYTCFEAVQNYETIVFNKDKPSDGIPTLKYDFYRFIISFDHFFETMEITENIPENEESQLDDIYQIINHQDTQTFDFKINGTEKSNITGTQFKDNIKIAKEHLKRGDVFQVVLSRRFEQAYTGDVFNVYRSLRSVNPSPYLYYFDYGFYRIFGSSPEAQIVVKNDKAEIHPIAGTFKRTGNYKEDLKNADELKADKKENAEHVMLVDLARNDLSKHATNVNVKKYKDIQFFSHVIHLTSVVEGTLSIKESSLNVFADTFPAGTLSGAPKFKAMEIIDKLETTKRGFYGGAIGMLGLNGDINHAILIRSFLAIDKTLKYQAGAGIVIHSDEESELQEVNNKLGALKAAIKKAENL